MGQKIQLSESQLRNLIKESVMNEIDRRKVMPGKYYDIFKNRIINAQHGRHGDIEKAVMEFYKDFKKKVPNDGFTPENLMDLAEKIADGEISGSHFVPWAGYGSNGFREIDAIGGDSDAFNRSYSGQFNEGRVRVTESQLRNLIKESVKKAIMNEISSDMISRASAKLYGKYGWNGTEKDKLEKDEHGNPLHPKDKKPMAQHFKNFSDAFQRAKRDEQMNDPVTREAMEIWNENESDVEWEITDDFENEGCEVGGYLEVNGWEFSATGYAERAGGLNVEEINSVEFRSPDGQEGSFRP